MVKMLEVDDVDVYNRRSSGIVEFACKRRKLEDIEQGDHSPYTIQQEETVQEEEEVTLEANDEETLIKEKAQEEKRLKRKLQKQMKKDKIRQEQELEMMQRFESQRSIYDLPKKLIILDLNKVLLYRKKGSKNFIPRPHVIPFLQQMSLRFHIAIWTSMQRHSAYKLQEEMFSNHQITCLFMWFQNRCVAEYRSRHQLLPLTPAIVSADDEGNVRSAQAAIPSASDTDNNAEYMTPQSETTINAEESGEFNVEESVESNVQQGGACSNRNSNGSGAKAMSKSQQKRIEYWQKVQKKRKMKNNTQTKTTSTAAATTTNNVSNSETDAATTAKALIEEMTAGSGSAKPHQALPDEKPIYHKPLTIVWREFKYFNETNTILIDDTEEKCVQNHEYNCIHPTPFELNLSDFEFIYIYTRPSNTKPLPTDDAELKEDSPLWQYLDELAKFPGSVKEYWESHGPYRRVSTALSIPTERTQEEDSD